MCSPVNLKVLLLLLLNTSLAFSQTPELDFGCFSATYINTKTFAKNNTQQRDKPDNHIQRNSTLSSQQHSLIISSNFNIDYLWIYNESIIGKDTLLVEQDSLVELTLEDGIYSIFAGFWLTETQHCLLIKDSLEVSNSTSIQLDSADATHSLNYRLKNAIGNPLNLSVVSFYFYSQMKETNFRATGVINGESDFTLRYNYLPGHFDKEWAVKAKQVHNSGDLYLISNVLPSGQVDSVISSQPQDLAGIDFQYAIADSIPSETIFRVATLFPDFALGSTNYSISIRMRIYQNTDVNSPLRSSTFFQFVSASIQNTAEVVNRDVLTTQALQISQDSLHGFYLNGPQEIRSKSYSLPIRNRQIQIGLAPVYWFGKFYNDLSSIRIQSPYTLFEYLFLSQSNDVPSHNNIDYRLYQDSNLVKIGKFPPRGDENIMFLGFDPDSMLFAVTPGRYKLSITNNDHEVNGVTGASMVTANFDLTQKDKNPPNLTLFQILNENGLQNILNPTDVNRVRFILEDETALTSTKLYYAVYPDTQWNEILLTNNPPFYTGILPVLNSNTYSLRLMASDPLFNNIDCVMSPAFMMDNSTAIEQSALQFSGEDNFELHPCYPNPFNNQVQILYTVYTDYQQHISLDVYDISGRHIKNLTSEDSGLGTKRVQWNGINSSGHYVASGVYLIQLRGGDGLEMQKVLLIK